MRNRTNLALASFALLAATLAGCGGAGADGNGAGAGASDDATTSDNERHEQMLKYAACLREHGVEVDDPKPGEGVLLKGFGPEDKQKLEDAGRECEDVAPPGVAEPPEGARKEMLETARCMREHGVEDFPDPKPGEGLNLTPEVAEDPDLEEAQKACMPDMPAPNREPRS